MRKILRRPFAAPPPPQTAEKEREPKQKQSVPPGRISRRQARDSTKSGKKPIYISFPPGDNNSNDAVRINKK